MIVLNIKIPEIPPFKQLNVLKKPMTVGLTQQQYFKTGREAVHKTWESRVEMAVITWKPNARDKNWLLFKKGGCSGQVKFIIVQ